MHMPTWPRAAPTIRAQLYGEQNVTFGSLAEFLVSMWPSSLHDTYNSRVSPKLHAHTDPQLPTSDPS